MAKVLVTESYLEDIADAIRAKLESEDTYSPSEMAGAIGQISGGATLISKTITENGTYSATDDNADGYSDVTVDVAGGGGGSTTYVGTTDPSPSQGRIGDAYVKYENISYLESTNTQYIDTGISGTNAYGYKIDFIPIDLNESYQSYLSGYLDDFTIGAKGTLATYYERLRGSEVRSGNLSNVERNVLERQNASALSTNASNIFVFSAPSGNRKSKMRLYSLIIYDANGDEIFHGIPAKDANNVACLYDSISEENKYNLGTGEFTFYSGREVVKTYVKVGESEATAEWLEAPIEVESIGSKTYTGMTDPAQAIGEIGDYYIKYSNSAARVYEESMTRNYTLTIVDGLRGSSVLHYVGAQEIQLFYDDGQGNEVNISSLSNFTYATTGSNQSAIFDGNTSGSYWEANPTPITLTFSATIPAEYRLKKFVVWQRQGTYNTDVWKEFTLVETINDDAQTILSKADLTVNDWAGAGNGTEWDFGPQVVATYAKIGETEATAQWVEAPIEVNVVIE